MKKSVPVKVLALLLASSIMPAPARAAVGTWNANPTNGDWNVPSNWSSLAAPNGPADIASFGLSSITSVFLSANTQVDSIIFNPGASGYTITAGRFRTLSISGAGVVNNSGVAQALVAAGADSSTGSGLIRFTQNAQVGASISLTSSGSGNVLRDGAVVEFRDASSGGNGTVTAAGGAIAGAWGGTVRFLNASTAAQAVIGVNPDAVPRAAPGIVEFHNASTAAQATITNNGARFGGGGFPDFGGEVRFRDNASAAQAVITNVGGTAPEAGGSITRFENSSTAANATIINNGSSVVGGFSGITGFYDNSNAGNSVIVSNGAIWGYTTGGVTLFAYNSDAGTATLIANSGPTQDPLAGGQISFGDDATGGTARVAVFGNGFLDIRDRSAPGVNIGSLEGTGTVFLGANTLSIGSNNLDTEFSGVIRNGGPFGNDPGGGGITKAGTGTLTLSGSSSYTRHTTVTAGTLIVNGSITSSASVNGGTLGGTGTMLAVNVENGGTVAPGGAGTGILTVSGNLSLGLGATYLVEVNGVSVGTEYDQTSVAGAVSLAGATLSLNLGFQPAAGMSFIVIDNDGTEDVAGTFAGLSEGSSFVADGQTFAISYAGGTGNDVVITAVVPEPATWLLLVGGAASLGISVRQQRSL